MGRFDLLPAAQSTKTNSSTGCAIFLSFTALTAHAQERNPQQETPTTPNTIQATSPTQPTLKNSAWHFQATYGVSSADVEAPYWNTSLDPAKAEQRSTTGVLTQSRYSHSFASPLNKSQSVRWGLALVSEQTAPAKGWMAALAKDSKAPDWRTWGVGTDLFLVRHQSPTLDFDAGVQADYFLSGVTTLGALEGTTAQSSSPNRLEQKSGWRIAFTGGLGGIYLGPVGIIIRLSGYVVQAAFKGHTQPLRAQGIQLQLGADLALGRGEP